MLFVSLSKRPQAYGLAMPVTHKLWDPIKCQVKKKFTKIFARKDWEIT